MLSLSPDMPAWGFPLWLWGVMAAALCLCVPAVRWIWRRGARGRAGRRAEKRVRRELGRLRDDEYQVINDLMIESRQGRTVQIDHLVISTRGVFVIETKGMTGHIRGSEQGQYWDQRFMMSSHAFYNPLLQNEGHIRALVPHLRGVSCDDVVSVVVFTDAWRVDVATDDPRRTLDPERVRRRWWCPWRNVRPDLSRVVTRPAMLRHVIRRYPRVMERERVTELADRVRGLDIRSGRRRGEHNRYVRTVSREHEAAIEEGRCPRCGAPLVLREGDYGPFYGCSDYPRCRFICSAAPRR